MPSNPFSSSDSGGQAAQVGSAQSMETAKELNKVGDEQIEYAKELANTGFDLAKPGTDLQQAVQQNQFQQGMENQAYYDSTYKPSEGLSTLDAYGLPWLGEEAQNTLITERGSQEMASLDDIFNKQMGQIDLAEQRAQASPFPGSEGAKSQDKYATDYAKQRELAQSDYDKARAQIERSTGYAKDLSGITRSAETAAVSRAHGDVVNAETRRRAGLARDAGRMGVDASRILQNSNAYAPSLAASAVGAGNNARFGIRNQRIGQTQNINEFGRGIPSAATQAYSSSVGAGQVAAGTTQSAINAGIAAPTTATGFYNAGTSALGAGISGSNTAQSNATQTRGQNLDIFGTVAGGAMGLIFSEKEKKTKRKRADTPETLEMVKKMDTDSWEYKKSYSGPQAPSGRHIGPYAEDMKKAGLSDGKTVHPMDTSGLALASVKQLAKDVDKIKKMIAGLPAPAKAA